MLRRIPERHSLLFLSQQGRAQAWKNRDKIYPPGADEDIARELITQLPAITRSLDNERSVVNIGFSLPVISHGGRWRVASSVDLHEIEAQISPWQALEHCNALLAPFGELVKELNNAGQRLGIESGIFGSAALQGVSGHTYLHTRSDLDVVLRSKNPEALRSFGGEIKGLEGKYDIGIDAELYVGDGLYVKLKELLSGAKKVLAKGGEKPELISKAQVWSNIKAIGN